MEIHYALPFVADAADGVRGATSRPRHERSFEFHLIWVNELSNATAQQLLMPAVPGEARAGVRIVLILGKNTMNHEGGKSCRFIITPLFQYLSLCWWQLGTL
jgi:hypothetical protein